MAIIIKNKTTMKALFEWIHKTKAKGSFKRNIFLTESHLKQGYKVTVWCTQYTESSHCKWAEKLICDLLLLYGDFLSVKN